MKLKDFVKQSGGSLSDMFMLPPDVIKIDPGFNVRIKNDTWRANVRRLADSMKNPDVGFMRNRPVTVRMTDDTVYLVDGETRLTAAILAISEGAKIERIPCLSEPQGTNDGTRDFQLILANEGERLSALEQSSVVVRLIRRGRTENEIAGRLGKTRQWVDSMIALAETPEEVQHQIAAATVSPTEALAIVRKNGVEAANVIRRAAAASPRGKATAQYVRAVSEAPKAASANDLRAAGVEIVRQWDVGNSPDFEASIETMRKLVGGAVAP